MSELRTILTDTVGRLLTDHVTLKVKQEAESGVWPKPLWDALEETGLPLVLVPEAENGAGGSWDDAYVLLRAIGEHQAPVPLAETILAAWLLSKAGHEVPTGPLTIAGPGLALEQHADGWRLNGTAQRVPFGSRSNHLVVVVPVGEDVHVALVATGDAEIEPNQNLAAEPRDHLTFNNVPVLASAPAPVPGDAVQIFGALIRSAQMAGALDSALKTAVGYVNERVQFGRPIGRFQAIQQQLAVLSTEVAAVGLASAFACHRVGDTVPVFEIAAAKTRAGDAAGMAASIAHQVHGAIGFTAEYGLHYATRRLWSWRSEFGAAPFWARRIGEQVSSIGADNLWPYVTKN